MASDSETSLPSAQFISLSSKTAAGRVYGGEYWDLYNWTPDMHPIHLHLVEFRIVARFVVGASDVDGSGYIDSDQEVAGGDCAQNAYFEYPEQSEIYAAKDIAKVYPARTTDNANVPFAQGFQPKCAPFTRIYAIFEDYAGSYVWHCHIIEHEDMVRAGAAALVAAHLLRCAFAR
jgi:spore coat protein A, manganese oxidase